MKAYRLASVIEDHLTDLRSDVHIIFPEIDGELAYDIIKVEIGMDNSFRLVADAKHPKNRKRQTLYDADREEDDEGEALS
jgi:hypothetical protein